MKTTAKETSQFAFNTEAKIEPAKIELSNLSKIYDNGIKAIDKINLTVNYGEFITLLGPSGCGKTTILRMIAGLETISEGHLLINDMVSNSTEPSKRNIAMVFQNYALYPFMNVFKNIAFGLLTKKRQNNVYLERLDLLKEHFNSNFFKEKAIKVKIKNLEGLTTQEKDAFLASKLKIKQQKNAVKHSKKNQKDLIKHKKILETLITEKEKFSKLKDLKKEKNKTEVEKLKSVLNDLKKNRQKRDWKVIFEDLKTLEKIVIAYKARIPKVVQEATDLVGISNYLNRKPSELSGGQRQRIALARAISKKASIFLYDEPLSNLDAKLRAKLRQELRQLHDALGATSIYVTHDQTEAMAMSDRIVVLHQGYVQQIGTPEELINQPANLFVARFVGGHEINVFDGLLTKDGLVIEKNGKRYPLKVARTDKMKKVTNLPVFVGIRPQNIILDQTIVNNMGSDNVFKGKIKSLHLLGTEYLVTIESELFGEFSSVIANAYNLSVGTMTNFFVNFNKITLFSKKDGYSLSYPLNQATKVAYKTWINGLEERNKNLLLLHHERNHMSLFEKLNLLLRATYSSNARTKLKELKKPFEVTDSIIAT